MTALGSAELPLRVALPTVGHWRAGAAWSGASTRRAPVYDPATGQQIRDVSLADVDDVDAVIRSAHEAWAGWRTSSLSTRSRVLFSFRELLAAHAEELAEVITGEHGKVLADAAGEVARGLEVAEFACGIPHLLKGAYAPEVSTRVDVHSLRQPLGVVAVISPFNFPAMVPLWFVPIAIGAGNAVCSSRVRRIHRRRWCSRGSGPRRVCRTGFSASCRATRSL